MNDAAKIDQQFVWHPFTQMRDWMRAEPAVIVSGIGTRLRDSRGRTYLDANSSIWTNLHGHGHPAINGAITRQLKRISHSSALGLANEPAALFAQELVTAANRKPTAIGQHELNKVFYSDNGSTAMEVALKLSYQFAQRELKHRRPRFLSLDNAYHGDTVGAVSLGHIDLFHASYRGLLFKSDKIPSPYCYRCPYNRAKPDRRDAREYAVCNRECLSVIEKKFTMAKRSSRPYSAIAIEPLMQGAAGMVAQPEGWLARVGEMARFANVQLIYDEVMTGFGRTGGLFAFHREGPVPDYVALAKGISGGYLPLAATLTRQSVFDAFLGEYSDFRTFFHGHSYSGNQLGCAAARASLKLLLAPRESQKRKRLELGLEEKLKRLWNLPNVGDIRRVGLMAGIELVRDWRTKEAFPLAEQVGSRVCDQMRRRGVLTRAIGNVIVLMPPYCTTARELSTMVSAIYESIEQLAGEGGFKRK